MGGVRSHRARPSSDPHSLSCLASAASERYFSPGSPEETPLHKMLFLPAAALCCLCSALVAMGEDLVQDQLSLTKRVGQSVSFSCGTASCVVVILTGSRTKIQNHSE
ncbi:uncharacterized protein AKAME5_001991900 [Lates japonicus]|uniref:Uncharacterized protein n=1 Tax=Lates japonicus TaxID=270547 RepID=A0AAD3N9C8_LATJO|nr:uncharacterized protein AKAME5_001991900 [Lates japonicus]